MDEPTDSLAAVFRLIEAQRPREAFALFLTQVEGRDWEGLSAPELRALDLVIQRVVPELLDHHTLWMVNHPHHLRQMLGLLAMALRAKYRTPVVLDQMAWLRCLLAVSEAVAGRTDRVHEELCLTREQGASENVPPPNGMFQEETKDLELSEGAVAAFLKPFFGAYVEFLRRSGWHELANHIEGRIGRLLGFIARDETRSGIVQALFYVRGEGGRIRFVHVSLEHQSQTEGEVVEEGGIVYARQAIDSLDAAMRDAAGWARAAADAYLKRTGYPDGLDERLVRWEIATMRGDPADLPRQYEGGSIALPLAVAILSEYLGRPVPNDVALTGAFTASAAEEGRILPVDGIPEKVEYAVQAGSRLVYVPSGNAPEVDNRPALRNLVAEHGAKVVSSETLGEVCQNLFPAEGSGSLKDTLKDAFGGFVGLLTGVQLGKGPQPFPPAHKRHRLHVLLCGLLVAVLVFLEGLLVYKGFASAYPCGEAWLHIGTATLLVLLGMWGSFVLADACLRHRKSWSWFAGIGLLTTCFGGVTLLLWPILPDETDVSRVYTVVPVAGMLKDLFVIWLFAWAIAGNTYSVVAAIEHLVERRQFVTTRKCLRWDSPLEARMPIRCVYFPWEWGALGIGVVTVILIILDLSFLGSLRSGTDAVFWYILAAHVRDLLFIIAIAEVFIFYKAAVAEARKAFSS